MQISFNDVFCKEPIKITKPIRLITLFSGYDSQALALKYLGVPFEHYRTCEWAIPSILALKSLHFNDDKTDYSKDLDKTTLVELLYKMGVSSDYKTPLQKDKIARYSDDKLRNIYNSIKSSHNMVSVTNIKGEDLGVTDTDKYDYIMTYSYPCQSLSMAGLRTGMKENSNTESALLWEVKRLLAECFTMGGQDGLPQTLLMENVPQVHDKKNKEDFILWLDFLESLGYHNYYQDLNAKNYGVPQNRNRCFCVSTLYDNYYTFPTQMQLDIRLKDILEKNVDESYYLSKKNIDFVLDIFNKRGIRNGEKLNTPIAKTISCRGAVDQRADVTNFIVNGCDKGYTVGELKNELSKPQGIRFNDGKVDDIQDVACTLLARDYKGLSKYHSNGVLEINTND